MTIKGHNHPFTYPVWRYFFLRLRIHRTKYYFINKLQVHGSKNLALSLTYCNKLLLAFLYLLVCLFKMTDFYNKHRDCRRKDLYGNIWTAFLCYHGVFKALLEGAQDSEHSDFPLNQSSLNNLMVMSFKKNTEINLQEKRPGQLRRGKKKKTLIFGRNSWLTWLFLSALASGRPREVRPRPLGRLLLEESGPYDAPGKCHDRQQGSLPAQTPSQKGPWRRRLPTAHQGRRETRSAAIASCRDVWSQAKAAVKTNKWKLGARRQLRVQAGLESYIRGREC